MDFLLRTNTESAMLIALESIGIVRFEMDESGNSVLIPSIGMSVDLIGPIGVDSRYHANLRADLTPAQIAALPTFTPLPVTPYRVFFD